MLKRRSSCLKISFGAWLHKLWQDFQYVIIDQTLRISIEAMLMATYKAKIPKKATPSHRRFYTEIWNLETSFLARKMKPKLETLVWLVWWTKNQSSHAHKLVLRIIWVQSKSMNRNIMKRVIYGRLDVLFTRWQPCNLLLKRKIIWL